MSRAKLASASVATLALALQPTAGFAQHAHINAFPIVKSDVADDLSPTLRSVAGRKRPSSLKPDENGVVEIGPEDEPVAPKKPSQPDGALQTNLPHKAPGRTGANFDGLNN